MNPSEVAAPSSFSWEGAFSPSLLARQSDQDRESHSIRCAGERSKRGTIIRSGLVAFAFLQTTRGRAVGPPQSQGDRHVAFACMGLIFPIDAPPCY